MRVRRIVIVGCPGNGKSTLARRLAERFGLDHIELDSLAHVTAFDSATDDEFRASLVARMDAAPDGWVTCGNYVRRTHDLHIARADTLIWLDLPRVQVTWRTLRRTVRRMVRREELFGNGIREPIGTLWRWDPHHNIVRWAWVNHPRYRRETPAHIATDAWSHLEVHHLTTQPAVDRFVAGLGVCDGEPIAGSGRGDR